MNRKQMVFGGLVIVAIVAIVVAVMATGKEEEVKTNNSQNHSDQSGGTNASAGEEPKVSDAEVAEAVEADEVTISNFAYAPKTIKVKVGTKVTWTNNDSVGHDVAADKPSADAPSSELLNKGESYSFTFKKAGTYSYHCTPHPYMRGTVIVTE